MSPETGGGAGEAGTRTASGVRGAACAAGAWIGTPHLGQVPHFPAIFSGAEMTFPQSQTNRIAIFSLPLRSISYFMLCSSKRSVNSCRSICPEGRTFPVKPLDPTGALP